MSKLPLDEKFKLRQQWLPYLMFSSVVILILIVMSPKMLAMHGYCMPELRKLSEREIISSAILNLISPSKSEMITAEGRVVKIIHLKSVEDFLIKNPDCCQIRYDMRGYLRPDVSLKSGHPVVVSYTQPYLDEQTNTISQEKRTRINIVTPCGLVKEQWQPLN